MQLRTNVQQFLSPETDSIYFESTYLNFQNPRKEYTKEEKETHKILQTLFKGSYNFALNITLKKGQEIHYGDTERKVLETRKDIQTIEHFFRTTIQKFETTSNPLKSEKTINLEKIKTGRDKKSPLLEIGSSVYSSDNYWLLELRIGKAVYHLFREPHDKQTRSNEVDNLLRCLTGLISTLTNYSEIIALEE